MKAAMKKVPSVSKPKPSRKDAWASSIDSDPDPWGASWGAENNLRTLSRA